MIAPMMWLALCVASVDPLAAVLWILFTIHNFRQRKKALDFSEG